MVLGAINQSVERYAAGKLWYWYLPLWLFGAYVFYELFQMDMAGQQMPIVLIVPYSFNFGLHEIAHVVTAFLPAILTAAAGSASEIILGVVLIVMGLWQRSYFAILFSALWFGLACQSAGQYMADAVPMQIPLVSLGGALSGQDALHDWNFVFGQLNLLDASSAIGMFVRVIGMTVAFVALAFTAWVLFKMLQTPLVASPKKSDIPPEISVFMTDDKIFAPKHQQQSPPSPDDAPPPGAHDSFS